MKLWILYLRYLEIYIHIYMDPSSSAIAWSDCWKYGLSDHANCSELSNDHSRCEDPSEAHSVESTRGIKQTVLNLKTCVVYYTVNIMILVKASVLNSNFTCESVARLSRETVYDSDYRKQFTQQLLMATLMS